MRIVADMIRGMEINKALGTPSLQQEGSFDQIGKTVAFGDRQLGTENEGQRLEDNTLCVKEIFVDGGKMLKRSSRLLRAAHTVSGSVRTTLRS